MSTSKDRMKAMRGRRRDLAWSNVNTDVPTKEDATLLYRLAGHMREGLGHEEAIALLQAPEDGTPAILDPCRLEAVRQRHDAARGALLDRFVAIVAAVGDDRLGRLADRLGAMESWLGIPPPA